MILIILDGVGINRNIEHNAFYQAKKPFWDSCLRRYPSSQIQTSGEFVGLPKNIMGNSEVGHLNMGGGRVISQDATRISQYAEEKGFESLPVLKKTLADDSSYLHLLGLMSDGCVHSDIYHLYHLLDLAKKYPKKRIFLHMITDGRDCAPHSGIEFARSVDQKIKTIPNVKASSVIGRFYAMDRDKRWERTQKAYDLLTRGSNECFSDLESAVQAAYKKGESDEFITPLEIIGGERISSKDQVIFFNFRADRARQISQAFTETFNEFPATISLPVPNWICMTKYKEDFLFPVLFSKQEYPNVLGEIISKNNLKQLRVAETEKYAHVTYYFNGGKEAPFPGEERILIPSPKNISTYDLKPEMSAFEITGAVEEMVKKEDFSFILINYANGDMIGHTGVEAAAIKAVEVLDQCLNRVVTLASHHQYEVLITADHGNCEQMVDPVTGAPFTQHTTFPVPLVWLSERALKHQLKDGVLADIAPTILELYGLSKPTEMTGTSLIRGKSC